MIEHHRLVDRLDYDAATGVFRWRVSPCPRVKAGAVAGCPSPQGWSIIIDGRSYRARRLAWFYAYGVWPSEVFNVNRDVNDNRLSNLREGTAEERWNRHTRKKTNAAGATGVYRNGGRFAVQVSRSGKPIHRSSHASLEEAVAARQTALSAFDRPGGGSGL